MEGWDICCYDENREPADCELFYNFRRIATTRCFVPRFVGKTCGKFMDENKILKYILILIHVLNLNLSIFFPFLHLGKMFD